MPEIEPIDEHKRAILRKLVGLPFLYAKPTYQEELTLHLGTEELAGFNRFPQAKRGSYVIYTRNSRWFWLKQQFGLFGGGRKRPSPDALQSMCESINRAQGKNLKNAEFVEMSVGEDHECWALALTLARGFTFDLFPEVDRPAGEEDVSDWEVRTPEGTLIVGPGIKMDWEPRDRSVRAMGARKS